MTTIHTHQNKKSFGAELLLHTLLFFGIMFWAFPMATFGQTTDPTIDPGTTQDQFQNQGNGLFNCNQTNAYGTSVGAFSAIGGVYVPVNDAAVTLNTGYLVYKECILRNVVNRQREAVMVGITANAIKQYETGRQGQALYAKKLREEIVQKQQEATILAQKDRVVRGVDPSVHRALTRAYVFENLNQNKDACPYRDNGSIFNAILNEVGDSRCNPVGLFLKEQEQEDSVRAMAQYCLEKQWEWGRGFYAVTENNPDTACAEILTPPATVQGSFQTALDSPIRQAESANDIGQLISPLYSNLASQAVSDLKGLVGLLQPQGGQLSYLDRMTRQASNNLQTAAINAAINTLNAVNGVESAYLAAKTALANKLTTTITQLRTAENQCWNNIISKVCTSAITAQNTCTRTVTTTTTGTGFGTNNQNTQTTTETFTLKIATTTTASQTIIDGQISPVATQVATDIRASESAIQMLAVLSAQAVSASTTLQQLALQQVDTLVSRGVLHSQYDLTQAQKQRDDASLLLTQLVQDTVESWAQSSDPNVGWCNTASQPVIDGWIARWKQ